MDYLAVNEYLLPIELMMENADLGLPASVYKAFHMSYAREFSRSGLLRCKFSEEI